MGKFIVLSLLLATICWVQASKKKNDGANFDYFMLVRIYPDAVCRADDDTGMIVREMGELTKNFSPRFVRNPKGHSDVDAARLVAQLRRWVLSPVLQGTSPEIRRARHWSHQGDALVSHNLYEYWWDITLSIENSGRIIIPRKRLTHSGNTSTRSTALAHKACLISIPSWNISTSLWTWMLSTTWRRAWGRSSCPEKSPTTEVRSSYRWKLASLKTEDSKSAAWGTRRLMIIRELSLRTNQI